VRRVLAALAALLLSAPAWATTFVVTNDTQRNTAVTTAVAGDLIDVRAGTYTGTFVPSNSGTAGNYITVKGAIGSDSVATRICTIGVSWSGVRSYISWKGINFRDDVQFTRADHCSLTYCKVDSGGMVSYGSNSDPTSTGISENNYIGDCTFRQNIGANGMALVFKRTERTTVQRCRFFQTITNAALDGRGRYLYRSSNNNFTDTYMEVECWGAENGEQFVQGIRDSSRNNTFTRDSIRIGFTSKRSRRCLMSQAGTFAGTATPNYWVDCDYRSWHEPATDNAFEWQDGTGGLCQGTVFASRMGRALAFPGSATTPGLVLRHVTAYSGGQQAFRYDVTTNPTTSRFNGLAIIARTAQTCGTATALYKLETLGAFASSDSNVFLAADTAYTFAKAAGGTVCYAPGAWRTATSNDLASRSYVLAAGTVTDTTWATLDLRPPSSASRVVSTLFPDGYAGAFNYTAPAATDNSTYPGVPPAAAYAYPWSYPIWTRRP